MEDRPTREETKEWIVSMLNADPPLSTHEILEALSARIAPDPDPRGPSAETEPDPQNRQIPSVFIRKGGKGGGAGC